MNTGRPRPALFWSVLNFSLYMVTAALMLCQGLPLPENQGPFWTLESGLLFLAAINMVAAMFQMFSEQAATERAFGMGQILIANFGVAVLIVLASSIFDQEFPTRAIAFCRLGIGFVVFINMIVFLNEKYPRQEAEDFTVKI